MPYRPKRPCQYVGCPNLHQNRNGFCDEHQSSAWKPYDQNRGSSSKRGYDARWRKIRDKKLRKHPICQECGKAEAVLVHHVDCNSFNNRGDNLQSVCVECHALIHSKKG